MKALQILAPGRAELVDTPLPEPGDEQVRVRVTMTSTCPQWDLHLLTGEPMFPGQVIPYPYPPGQPGHEMTGVVDALGPEAEAFAVGQPVVAWRDQGHHRAGCYAEYAIVEQDNLLPVPAEIELARVASLELAMCVASSVMELEEMNAIAGRTAGVNGLGPAGLVAAQLLRAAGATRVVGFEPHPARRQLALEQGLVNEALDPGAPATAARFPNRHRRGSELGVAIECCGRPAAVHWLMDRVGSHLALFAVQRQAYLYTPHHAGLILVGYGGHHRVAAEYALERVLDGRLDLALLVSDELPLSRYQEGVERLRRQEAIKIAFRP